MRFLCKKGSETSLLYYCDIFHFTFHSRFPFLCVFKGNLFEWSTEFTNRKRINLVKKLPSCILNRWVDRALAISFSFYVLQNKYFLISFIQYELFWTVFNLLISHSVAFFAFWGKRDSKSFLWLQSIKTQNTEYLPSKLGGTSSKPWRLK